MYSFRELVESMEKKTSESGKKQHSPTQPAPENISTCEAFTACEITRRSQCKVEATNETGDEWERRERLWDCNESVKDKEQARLDIWWREEESGVMRVNEQYKSSIEYEATHPNRKEIGEALILKRKYMNMTSGQLNSSKDNLNDLTKLNCYVLPHQEGGCYLAYSSPDVHGLKRRVSSNQGYEYEQEHDSQQDSSAHSFRRPNEDKYPVSDKHQYLEGCKRKVSGIDNQYKARERTFLSEGKGYSLKFSDDTGSNCQRLGAGSLRIATSLKGSGGGTLEKSTFQEMYFNATRSARQCDGEWHREATSKGTSTQVKSQQTCNPNSSFMTTPLKNNPLVAAPLIRDSQQTKSVKFKNASHCYFRIKDKMRVEHEWTEHTLSSHEKQQKSKNSFNLLSTRSLRLGKNVSTKGTAASKRRNSGIPFTYSKRNLSKKLNGASHAKHLYKGGLKTDKSSQDEKAHNISRKNRNETQNAVSEIQNKDEDTRGNEEPRSTSPTSLKFRCPHCSCWWQDEASLARHLRQHALARPFACPDCPSRFNQLVHLQIHRRTHTGEKPFRCATCSASFSRKDRLRSHERRHSGEQPYTCPYCSLSFRDAASLKSHVSVHAHQPPFTCRICRSTFAHLSTFTTHWRLHK